MSKQDDTEDDNTSTQLRHLGVMVEHLADQQQSMLEIMAGMDKYMQSQLAKQEDLEEMKADTKVIKAAVTDTSRELHSVERRVTRLEATN